MLQNVDPDMGACVYIKARANAKVVAALAGKGEFEKMGKYCEMAGYKPDYSYLLQSTLMNNPQGAVNIAIQIGQQDPPPYFNTVADLFLQRNMIREATSFLLDVLKNDNPEQAGLQTKVLEINLVTFLRRRAILDQGKLTRLRPPPRGAAVREGWAVHARAAALHRALGPQALLRQHPCHRTPGARRVVRHPVSRVGAGACASCSLTNSRQNLQIIVNICKEYTEQLTSDSIISLLEEYNSSEDSSSTSVPSWRRAGIGRTSSTSRRRPRLVRSRRWNASPASPTLHDPEKAKVFLMEAKLPDARPLINVCDRHGFVGDLTTYLYQNNMMEH